MSLRAVLEEVLLKYPEASKENFKGHGFAKYFRKDIPELVATNINAPDIYKVKASSGNGAWAKIPWIAIFNQLVTESVTSGFYCVYLFRADFSGVYLSLIQGIADKRDKYGLGVSRDIVRSQAKLFRDIIQSESISMFSDTLDLHLNCISKETTSRRLGLAYEAGNIVSKFYHKDKIPSDSALIQDLNSLISVYFSLFENLPSDSATNTFEDSEEWFEDLSKYKLHRVAERNQRLSKRVKQIQGYVCKACNFDFEKRYGEVGRNFIEAHHIVPISSLDQKIIQLDPVKDFTVLCSNCHRMIHRMKPTPSLSDFKKILVR